MLCFNKTSISLKFWFKCTQNLKKTDIKESQIAVNFAKLRKATVHFHRNYKKALQNRV